MKRKHGIRYLEILGLISLLLACVEVLYAGLHFNTNNPTVQWGEAEDLTSGWQYQSKEGRHDIPTLPAKIDIEKPAKGEMYSLTIYHRLPDELPEDPVLTFNSSQMVVEVFLDGETIYEYGVTSNAPVGRILGSPWNVVNLSGDFAGKEIAVRLSSPYAFKSFFLPSISLSSKAEAFHDFFSSNIGIITFCLILGISGFVILFIAIFFKIKKLKINFLSLVYLSLFIFLSAVWIITDSRALLLATQNLALIYFTSHISFMLMPLPLMLFFRQTTQYKKRGYSILCLLYILNFTVLTSLYFCGIAELEKTLVMTHVLMIAGLAASIVFFVKEQLLYHNKITLTFLIGLVALAAGLIISLPLFFFTSRIDNSLIFRIVLIVLILLMFHRGTADLVLMMKKGLEGQIYHRMAYYDAITELPNRWAFEQYMQEVQEKPDCRTLTIVVFDINRLKYMNDTYGHSAGDDLIKSAAKCIQDDFGQYKTCYRIGGDEFAAILKDVPDETMEQLILDFQKHTVEKSAGKMSIAVGYASGPAGGEKYVWHLFKKADENMYRNKQDHPNLSASSTSISK